MAATKATKARQRAELDVKGHAVGRRSGAAVVIGRVEPRAIDLGAGERAAIECYTMPAVPIRKRGDGAVELAGLFQYGERYHNGRGRLIRAHRAARDALDMLDDASGDTGWRLAVRLLLDASTELEAVGVELGALAGVTAVAHGAVSGSAALTTILRAGADAEAGLNARVSWETAESMFAPHEDLRARKLERLEKLGFKKPRARGKASVSHGVRHLRSHLDAASTERDRVYVAIVEATHPRAPGSIGHETIIAADAEAALNEHTTAWLAWCSAGRGDEWLRTWDSWPLLNQFALATIGRARGAVGDDEHVADAVRKSRKRA
jgi:hypothetical protein